jgi:hypothetical protein
LSQGRHLLELTAVLGGSESARSRPLLVNVTAAAPLRAFVSADGSTTRPRASAEDVAASACLTGARPECYDLQVAADGLGSVTSLSPTPDGRLLFIEDASRVRVIAGGVLLPEAALVADGPARRLVGLAVDSDFAATRSVFVAWTEPSGDGGVFTVSITRYRELQNMLAQGATIVTGLPVPPDARVPLAVDDAGLLCVALPGTANAEPPTTNHQPPTSGVLLRYTRDGLTPRDNPRASPVVAEGYSRPGDLAVDSAGGRLWLAGRHSGWSHVLSWIPTTISAAGTWPVRPVGVVAAAGSSGSPAPGLAILPGGPSAGAPLLLLAVDGRLLARALSSGADDSAMRELDMGLGPNVLGIGGGFEDRWYVVLDQGGASVVLGARPDDVIFDIGKAARKKR